jgi:hypothetical protein
MPYCPECRKSYEEGVVLCRDCRSELVAELAPGDEGPFVALRDVPDPVTGAMWKGALESQGLHVVIQSHALPGFGEQILRDWSAQAWGTLMVPRAEYDEAYAMLEDFLATAAEKAPAPDQAQEGEAPESPEAAE